MEKEFGYDGKHAMHLVRLLRMGFEIISTGQVVVTRPDAEELLEIRNGSWPLEQLLEYATAMEIKIEEAEADSPLPWGPDEGSIEDWMVAHLGSYRTEFQWPGPRAKEHQALRLKTIEGFIRE